MDERSHSTSGMMTKTLLGLWIDALKLKIVNIPYIDITVLIEVEYFRDPTHLTASIRKTVNLD